MNDTETSTAETTQARAFSDIVVGIGVLLLIVSAVMAIVLVEPLIVLLAGALIIALGWAMAREGG